MLDARTAFQWSRKLGAFVGAIARGQSIPAQRFVKDALTGLLAAGDVKLSEWARELDEDTELIYTEKRLSRWMGSKRLDDASLCRGYRAELRRHLRGHTIAVDDTDIQKPHARKMPHLDQVRDGSKAGHPIGPGWHVLGIEAISTTGTHAPLTLRLYSTKAPGYKSKNHELRQAIVELATTVPKDAIWAFDRGFDGRRIYDLCQSHDIRFAVRMRVKRRKVFHTADEEVLLSKLIARLPHGHYYRVQYPLHDRFQIQLGWADIALNERVGTHDKYDYSGDRDPASGRGLKRVAEKKRYSIVIIRDPARAMRERDYEPIVVITNIEVRSAQDAEQVAEAYLQRWGIEEGFRFQKQCFNLEDVRVLRWRALKRMLTLVTLAYGFLALQAFRHAAPVRALLTRVRRAFGEVPRYIFYRLHEAVGSLLGLRCSTTGPRGPPRKGKPRC